MRRRIHSSFTAWIVMVSVIGLGIPTLAQAQGGYLGVDAATRWSDVDWGGGTDHYTTEHLRLKGGFDFDRNFGFELRIASGDDDTFNDFVGTWKWEAGTTFSGYLRPHVSLSSFFDLYGLVGMSLMDTSYQLLGSGLEDRETVWSFDLGFGGQFNVSPHFAITLEILHSFGYADYPMLTTGVNLDGTAVGAGVLFRF